MLLLFALLTLLLQLLLDIEDTEFIIEVEVIGTDPEGGEDSDRLTTPPPPLSDTAAAAAVAKEEP